MKYTGGTKEMSKSLVFIDDFFKEEIYEIFKLADKFADDVNHHLIVCEVERKV